MTINEAPAAAAPVPAAQDNDQYRAVRAGVLRPRVSVIIPALNEARNLPHVFAALPAGLHEVGPGLLPQHPARKRS